MSRLFLGIDTSCYTTSVAACVDDNIISLKKPLEVKAGECGLRQSEAFFQHSKNLPVLFEELQERIDISQYAEKVVTVSSRPRNIENSYMPVFTAGTEIGKIISVVSGADYLEVSHQEGHIMAALFSCGDYSIMERPFLTYHISGGTTELLLVEKEKSGFKCEIMGGTKDLPAGQFIDRIGVKSGLTFPCGRELDKMATEYFGTKPGVKTCVNEEYINFSGEETRFERMLGGDTPKDLIAYCTMKCISESLKKSIISAKKKFGVKNVLMVGGVSSSQFIKSDFSDTQGVFFAEPEFCTDNAAGTCLMGKMNFGEIF